jgi:hypothetical protein
MKAKKFHRTLALGAFVMLAMNMTGMSKSMAPQMGKMQMPNMTMEASMDHMPDMDKQAMEAQMVEKGSGM